jgi:hypothetical protein
MKLSAATKASLAIWLRPARFSGVRRNTAPLLRRERGRTCSPALKAASAPKEDGAEVTTVLRLEGGVSCGDICYQLGELIGVARAGRSRFLLHVSTYGNLSDARKGA